MQIFKNCIFFVFDIYYNYFNWKQDSNGIPIGVKTENKEINFLTALWNKLKHFLLKMCVRKFCTFLDWSCFKIYVHSFFKYFQFYFSKVIEILYTKNRKSPSHTNGNNYRNCWMCISNFGILHLPEQNNLLWLNILYHIVICGV